jgi:hypothetical protein
MLVDALGQVSPTGAITIPEDCLSATVRYTSRTPTHGLLREAMVVALQPADGKPQKRDQGNGRSSRPITSPP